MKTSIKFLFLISCLSCFLFAATPVIGQVDPINTTTSWKESRLKADWGKFQHKLDKGKVRSKKKQATLADEYSDLIDRMDSMYHSSHPAPDPAAFGVASAIVKINESR